MDYFTIKQTSTHPSKSKAKIKIGFTIVFAFFFLGNLNFANAGNRTTDSLELVRIYNELGGSNWSPASDYSDWLNGPLEDWEGVVIAGNRVSVIDLSNSNLTGQLSNYDFSRLTILDLRNNNISGTIPSFSRMQYLTSLRLTNNQLSGSIPNFRYLRRLVTLDLFGNSLTGSIPNFSNFAYLYLLNLGGNNLSGTIPNFSRLYSLEFLYLSNNNLSGSVPNFSNLSRLKSFSASRNQLTGSIPNFFRMISLEDLSLSYNQISGNIPNFENTPNLETIVLNNNLLESADAIVATNISAYFVDHNRLTYDDILPNLYVSSLLNDYSNQAKIFSSADTTIRVYNYSGYILDLDIDDDVTTNTYKWYKDGRLISTTSTNQFVIRSFSMRDVGTYNVTVTNSIAGETLETYNIDLVAAFPWYRTSSKEADLMDNQKVVLESDFVISKNGMRDLNIRYSGTDIYNVNVLINDVQGRVLYSDNIDLINGQNSSIEFNNRALDGIFFITILNENSVLKSEKILFLE